MVGIPLDLFLERENQPRLADAGFAIDQRQPALAVPDLAPAPLQQREFFLAADQFCGFCMQRFEAAGGRAFRKHLRNLDGTSGRFQLEWPEIAIVEQRADQAPRGRGNY